MKEEMKSEIDDSILLEVRKLSGVKMSVMGSIDRSLIGENKNDEKKIFTSMSATILNTAETITRKLKNASADRIIMEYDGGKIIIIKAGQKAFISTIVAHEASLDSVFTELENAVGIVDKD